MKLRVTLRNHSSIMYQQPTDLATPNITNTMNHLEEDTKVISLPLFTEISISNLGQGVTTEAMR